jgi:hypothetical protein
MTKYHYSNLTEVGKGLLYGDSSKYKSTCRNLRACFRVYTIQTLDLIHL